MIATIKTTGGAANVQRYRIAFISTQVSNLNNKKDEVLKMKNYNKTERKEIKLRGWVAVVFAAISAVITLTFLIKSVGGDDPIHEVIAASLMFGFVIGGIVPGFTHVSAIFNKLKILLAFPVIGWAIMLELIIGVPFLGGWIFMIVDLVKFLLLRREEKKYEDR